MTLAELKPIWKKHPDVLYGSKSFHLKWMCQRAGHSVYWNDDHFDIAITSECFTLDDYVWLVPSDKQEKDMLMKEGTIKEYIEQGLDVNYDAR